MPLGKISNNDNTMLDLIAKRTIAVLENKNGKHEDNALLDLGAKLLARNEGKSVNMGISINEVFAVTIQVIDKMGIGNALQKDEVYIEVFHKVCEIAEEKIKSKYSEEDDLIEVG